jgi:hypothetical protein
VDVIIASTDLQSSHLVLSRDPADKSPGTRFKIALDPVNAVLSAKDNVIVQRRVGVGHL